MNLCAIYWESTDAIMWSEWMNGPVEQTCSHQNSHKRMKWSLKTIYQHADRIPVSEWAQHATPLDKWSLQPIVVMFELLAERKTAARSHLKRLCTCGDLSDELSGVVAALHQQMSPGGQVLGRIHSEHMGLHALLRARTQTKREVRVQERRTLPWARVD